MDTPRHTAQEVAEQVASGMDPDVESVAAQYYDAMKAERDALQRKLDAVIAVLKPAKIDWSRKGMESPEYHAWCLLVPLYGQIRAIVEGGS